MRFKHYFLTESDKTNKFIHMSDKPIEDLDFNFDQNHNKPVGLWAGLGKNWIRWVEDNHPKRMGEYFYTFNVKEIVDWKQNTWVGIVNRKYTNSVIRLKPDKISQFNFEFSTIMKKPRRNERDTRERRISIYEFTAKHEPHKIKVDWEAVSNACGGVLFSPYEKYYFNANEPESMWYHDIDIPSLCVFKEEAIRNWKQVPSKLFLDSPR